MFYMFYHRKEVYYDEEEDIFMKEVYYEEDGIFVYESLFYMNGMCPESLLLTVISLKKVYM